MEAKAYLRQLKRLDVCIKQKQQECDELRAAACSIGATDYSKDKVLSSVDNEASFTKTIHRLEALMDEVNNQIDTYVDLKHKIINQIQQLQNPKFIEILFKHYVEDKRLEQVAVEMNYTYQYVVELHGYALVAFNNILLKTYI